MIINNLNVFGKWLIPYKNNTPLAVDSDAVKSFPVSLQLFQSVGGWDAQIFNMFGNVNHPQFPAGGGLNFVRQFLGTFAIPDFFSFLIAKRKDQYYCVSLVTSKVIKTSTPSAGFLISPRFSPKPHRPVSLSPPPLSGFLPIAKLCSRPKSPC